MTDKASNERPCTCHPSDNPPVPCARKYALTECVASNASIPKLENCGTYLAQDNTGQWHYLNHAGTWQGYQGPSTLRNAQSEAVAYWAVHSLTGAHVGLWEDETYARNVLKEYADGTITPLYTHPAPPLAVTDEMVERAAMNQERKRVRLPALGSELFEFYPAMSAQAHEHAVKEYARKAIQASARQVDEAMIGRAYQAAYDALLGTSADVGVGELDRLVRAALTAALEAKQ